MPIISICIPSTMLTLQEAKNKTTNMLFHYLKNGNEKYNCFDLKLEDCIISFENITVVEKNNATITIEMVTEEKYKITITNKTQQFSITTSNDILYLADVIYTLMYVMQKKAIVVISQTEFSFGNVVYKYDNGMWISDKEKLNTQNIILKCSVLQL